MANLAQFLVETAQREQGRPALRLGDQVIGYTELEERSARAAALLRAEGVRPGDRVALMLPNVPEFVALYYGVLRAGAVVVPMNPLLKTRETEYHLRDSGAVLLLEWHQAPGEGAPGAAAAGVRRLAVEPRDFAARLAGHEPLPGVAETADDDVAVLLYTSGTTGRPKGATLTHGGLRHNTEVNTVHVQRMTPEDVVVGCLPLFHIFGQICTMSVAVRAGASLTLIPRFEPQAVLDAVARDRATVFEGVPTMYAALLQHPSEADVSTLRMCVSGGASLPVEILHGFERRFGCAVLEGFGMSETSPVVTFNHPDRPRKAGSIGTPIQDVEVRLLDDKGQDVAPGEVGELAVRGPNVMKGYWNRPEETAAAIPDGWLRSGDLARRDEDGYLYIVDRKKDMIIRGGYNVYPREIEEVLHEHPAVALAAVVGVPHTHLGEEIAAAVVLRPGAQADPDELREFVRDRVAAYKYPREVWLVDTLPTGPSGKILKREITAPAG
ncbi:MULTISPECIES: long-chain-fatty-acid--CoA ligase [Streptomyces]|uniref:long-chain-fatty-acid--CoA ligase n=1 Tax=Streptomyces TaxID=1883 RepID=UPI000BC6C3F9|nr:MULTISPECIES: long-chain fatty acid--CoA ligase [Streptomyces]MDX2552283.1 long-chain fatty acid--CoA ligase [Streptomyces stelliscabiei]MDX2611678.1 long-chain fatty acid--CoA ligase [Streptomyces stelliscabiei]MDX2637027.1 long-chain fatty acid--CoA ligase [Streptomyces stelliscabiei]MDX2660444.1 long-chain fatty acid--CoA ligase [Streptomyces stelliscabiei]MDX2714814.1 long-chain fatty acid--CoA ligase [Streptomyces stelliscabiei]